jgi:hypothetical protein
LEWFTSRIICRQLTGIVPNWKMRLYRQSASKYRSGDEQHLHEAVPPACHAKMQLCRQDGQAKGRHAIFRTTPFLVISSHTSLVDSP